MIIAETVLEAALAQVFAGHGPGKQLPFSEVAQAWSHTGLRKSDLRDAIRAAVDQQALRSCSGGGELLLELTETGSRRYNESRTRGDNPMEWLERHRQPLAAA